MKKIIVKISPDGFVHAETINMKGHVCQHYIEKLEKMTNSVAVDSKYKRSFFENTSTMLTGVENESEDTVSNRNSINQ